MARLSVYERPGLAPPREFQIESTLGEALIAHYPEGFDGARPVCWHTPRHGATHQVPMIEALELELSPEDVIHLLLLPRGPLGVAGALAVSVIVASLLVFAFIAPPRRTEADELDDQSSQVPDLRRSNQLIKVGSRIPSIYGTRKIFPSLATPGYVVHTGTSQELTELFVIGEGKYNALDPKLGDTLLSDLEGAGVELYGPNQKLPEDIRTIRANRNVDKLFLRAPDEVVKQSDTQFIAPNRIQLDVDLADDLANALAFRVSGSASNDGVYRGTSSGGAGPFWVDVSGTIVNETVTGVRYELPRKSRDQRVRAVPGKRIELNGNTLTGQFNWKTIVYSGGGTTRARNGIPQGGMYFLIDPSNTHGLRQLLKCTAASYSEETIEPFPGRVETVDVATLVFETLEGASPAWSSVVISSRDDDPSLLLHQYVFDVQVTGSDIATEPNWTEWYQVGSDAVAVDEIWYTYGWPGGLWQQEAGKKRRSLSVTIAVQYQRLAGATPAGTLYTDTISGVFNSRDTLRFTKQYALDTPGKWRVRWRRVENERLDQSDHYYQDETRIFDLVGASTIRLREFRGLSTLVLRQVASDALASLADRRLNIVVQRKLLKLNAEGALSAGEGPTNRMVDAFLDTAINSGRYSTSDIDMVGLATIQNALDAKDGGSQGEFSHVFTQTISVDEQLQAIADACRCVPYRIGQKLYLSRDEEQPEPGQTLFNRRNMMWENFSRVFGFRGPGEPDGIALKWVDPSNDFAEREYTYPDDGSVTRAKRMTIPGIANWAQAYRRCRFEYDSLRFSVDSLGVTVFEEAQMLVPFDMVRVEDVLIHRFRAGEVMSYDSGTKTLTLDRKVFFESPQLQYTVVLRAPNGLAVEELTCSPGAQPDQIVLSQDPVTEILDGARQLRTLFCFGAQDGHIAERWSVATAKSQRNKVRLTLVNYSAERFASDAVAIPPVPTL